MTSVTTTTAPRGFAELWKQFPWPDAPPVPEAPLTGRDSSGFPLLEAALKDLDKEHPVIMEIGAEFGGSTRKFLSYPGTFVVSVDPWPDTYGGGSFPELRPFLGGKKRCMYDLFLTFNFELRDRLATVRSYSPAGPIMVHDAGVEVDMIYIDGDHRYEQVIRDLTIAGSLFPNAVLTGDDWLFDPRHKKYEGIRLPVQTAVKRWASVSNMHVETEGNSWLIDPGRPYNLDRPVPAFDGERQPTSPTTGAEDEIRERLREVERSVRSQDAWLSEMARVLGQIERSLRNLPSRRLLRGIRDVFQR